MNGYKIGLPVDDMTQRTVIFRAMKRAVSRLHSEHKLVHLDMYLSNIMWKWNEDKNICDVCIVDFDSVHEEGEPLSSFALKRLQLQGFESLPAHATFKFDDLYMSILESNLGATELSYREDQNAARETMDEFFKSKLAEYLSGKPSLPWN